MKRYKKGLFVFRRDLRLEDNVGLIEMLKDCEQVIPIFIFDSRQTKQHAYKSENALLFMIESLKDLQGQLKKKGGRLYFFEGVAERVIEGLIKKDGIDAVYLNRDYTPFSRKRDNAIRNVCEKQEVYFRAYDSILLNAPDKVLKDDGKPYTVYTPYMRKARKNKVGKILGNRFGNYYTGSLKGEMKKPFDWFSYINEDLKVRGGRSEALRILNNIERFDDYEHKRDFPDVDETTHLSAYLKFGCVSPREVYWAVCEKLGVKHGLINQLYWRDFYVQIAFYFPHVFGRAFKEKYDKVKWSQSKKNLKAWQEGKTGFPIVDAGMRELNVTGFMHNRVRMIVASFLVKDLHIDWREGEKYFATKLVDYDPAVNNGNWQWGASTGCDAQPYFRIFNPWSQGKKFDEFAEYIKRWVPELEGLEADEIHSWFDVEREVDYPKPIVDHKEVSKQALEMFKRVV